MKWAQKESLLLSEKKKERIFFPHGTHKIVLKNSKKRGKVSFPIVTK